MKLRLIPGLILVLVVLVSISTIQCLPPSSATTTPIAPVEQPKPTIDRAKCDLYLSFAYSYYQNQNWKSAIENYKKMISYGCEEEYAQDIFTFWGRAYQQLASENQTYLDSALFVFLKGENYLPKDLYLKKNIAYIYRMQGKADLEIREYEKMLEITPDDVELWRTLVKLYINVQRYSDVIDAVNAILKINPNDEQAINDRIFAYQKLGKDITSIQREQWEKNPTNIRYGLEYASALKQQREFDKAIEVYTKIAQLDAKNLEVYTSLADLYQFKNKTQETIKTLEHIHKEIAPRDLDVVQKICKGYQQLADYPTALIWAEKAVNINASSALAFKIRADLYFNAADYFTSGRQSNFEDKLVYKLAYDDYRRALELGDVSVKSRLDHLQEYLIPSKEDWFFNRFDEKGNSRASSRPRNPVYNWITAEPKKD